MFVGCDPYLGGLGWWDVTGETFRRRDEARRVVFDWLECFYNVKRRHSTLGYVSPTEFENMSLDKKAA